MTQRLKTCSGPNCTATIFIASTQKRSGAVGPMPYDAQPIDHADARAANMRGIYRYESEDSNLMVKVEAAEQVAPDANLYRTHWATCPDGETFRTRNSS